MGRDQVFERATRQEPTAVEDRHTGAEVFDLGEVVRRVDDRGFISCRECRDGREETGPGAHIDAGRRLIQQQHPRTVQQGHRGVQSPFLATREVTCQAREKLGELENLGDLLDALVS